MISLFRRFRLSISLYCLLLVFILVFTCVAPAQTPPVRLTMSSAQDINPVWNPVDNRVVFLTNRPPADPNCCFNIGMVNGVSGSGETVIATGPTPFTGDKGFGKSLSWLNQDRLFVEEQYSSPEILQFNILMSPFARTVYDGSDQAFTPMLQLSVVDEFGAMKVSRDGSRVIWRVFQGVGNSGAVEIRSADPLTLSNNFGGIAGVHEFGVAQVPPGSYADFDIAPDGSVFILGHSVGSGQDLWLHETGGGALIGMLTNDAQFGIKNEDPAISPDGKEVMFVKKGTSGNSPGDIYLMKIDGSGVKQITFTPGLDESHPTWSPDGTMIAYERYDTSLGTGEPANANIYMLLKPHVAPTPPPPPNGDPTLTKDTELTDPPAVDVDDDNESVTILMPEFTDFDLSAAEYPEFISFMKTEAAKRKKKIYYEAKISKEDGSFKRRKNSKKNSITFTNLEPGTYTAKYRVKLGRKRKNKHKNKNYRYVRNYRTVIRTNYSPSQTFVRSGLK